MHGNRMDVPMITLCLALICGCGGGGGGGGSEAPSTATEISIYGSPATNGVFDAAPTWDGRSLWMSYSSVLTSPNDGALSQVRTRIASSQDAGQTWTDVGVDPNNMANADFLVPDGSGGTIWATWRFEVSRLLYDPNDTDASRRWKILWHRYVSLPRNTRLFQFGWIGLSTASNPDGPWSAERKLFTGTGYSDTTMNTFIGAPEFPLAAMNSSLDACVVYTEPGLLANAGGIYVSLQCAAATPGAGKIVLLKCDHAFSSCGYLGTLLTNGEAAQYSQSGHTLSGFASSELAEKNGTNYLIVTGEDGTTYRGCLVFRINDLDTAALDRDSANHPVLVKRVEGDAGSFNGACGYVQQATASNIIYGEAYTTAPEFRLFASHVDLP